MRTKTIAMIAAAASALALSACGGDKAPEVSDAWSRVTAPSQTTGAVYLTIKSDTADKLTAVAVPTSVAARAELHETMSGGTEKMGEMKMQPVDSIEIPAGATVQLKPGGFHIMLFELAKPIAAGEKIEVTLTFEKAGTQQVTAVAREG